MKNARKIICLLISSIMICALLPAHISVDAEASNIARLAKLSADFVMLSGEGIGNLTDGQYPRCAVIDPKYLTGFPYHIVFDFNGFNARIDMIKWVTNIGKDMGVTNIDIEYMQDDQWQPLRSNISFDWKYGKLGTSDEATVEFRDIAFGNPVTAEKFRIRINSANMLPNMFRIAEIEFYGEIVGFTKEVTGTEKQYLRFQLDDKITMPQKTTVYFADGSNIAYPVTWGNVLMRPGVQKIYGTIEAVGLETEIIVELFDPNDVPDYSNGEWYANYIKPLVRKGILRLNNKSAEDTVTRDLFASVLFKNFDMEFPREYTKVFTDLDSNEAIYDIYMTAYSSGALSGIIQGDEFGAGTEVSRIEALQAIYNCLDVEDVPDVDELPYNDIGGITPEQKTVLAYFYENQYIAASESFRPQDGITIAELAVVLGNLTGIDLGSIQTTYFKDNDAILRNPNMGLFAYYIDNEMTGYEISGPEGYYYEEIPGMSVMYLRGGWALFEPEEGKYDWSLIDMALQKYGSVGMQVALRITCADGFYTTVPKWVWDSGATYGMWGSSLVPVWEDPIFLEKLDNFLRALGEKYNGHPGIAYIDVGTLGIYGEGHMMEMSTYPMPLECILAQFDMYERYFPDTLKVANDPIMHNTEWIPILLEKGGFGYRSDVIPGDRARARFFTSDLLERIKLFWEKGPIIFEPDHYDSMLRNNEWGNGSSALDLVNEAHASFFGLHGMSERMYRENPEIFDAISRRLGYRLIPGEVSIPQEVEAHGYFEMIVDWKNVGAAPCYKGAYPTLTLKNKDGDIVLVLTDRDFNVKDLPVGEPGEVPASVVERATFRAGSLLPGGEYDAFISVGELDGTPTIAMPIDGDDGAKRYYVGSIKVQGMYDVTASQIAPSKLRMDFTVRSILRSYSYYISVGRLLGVETGVKHRHHEFIIDLPTQSLRQSFAEKKPFSMEIDLPIPNNYFDKPLQDPALLKGKRFNVWLEILNNTSGPENINYMTADRGRNSYLGVMELDDNMNWVFTPGDTPE